MPVGSSGKAPRVWIQQVYGKAMVWFAHTACDVIIVGLGCPMRMVYTLFTRDISPSRPIMLSYTCERQWQSEMSRSSERFDTHTARCGVKVGVFRGG